jgi:AdoMet dependent proline di-methyltransferase
MQEIKSDELWKSVKTADGGDEEWYKVAVDYWDRQEASYNGVLGGYGFVSDIDLRDSQTVLLKVCSRVQVSVHDMNEVSLTDVP